MARRHDKLTIAGFAIIAMAVCGVLHEGIGHGVTAWLRGDHPTELTSNHLSADLDDRLVSAGGTIVNLVVGVLALLGSRRIRDDTWRYAVWILAALNLMLGAGYFLFSGVMGLGDWQSVIAGVPGYAIWRIAMAVGGGVIYVIVVGALARAIRDYSPDVFALWIVPYVAAVATECLAGALDPLGMRLFVISTIPAACGGLSGFIWGSRFVRDLPGPREHIVERRPAVWIAALIVGAVYVATMGRGIALG
ncbi:MAG TPA: hypothetical protein VGG74_07620 [Kofleriaceae bacterium]